jgi:fibronectin type 3 domain-containing protein
MTPPAAPRNLSATVSSTGISLSWSTVAGASSYVVYRSTVTGGPYTAIKTVTLSARTSDGSASSGTPYYYVVTAVNAAGASGNSNEAMAALSQAIGTHSFH